MESEAGGKDESFPDALVGCLAALAKVLLLVFATIFVTALLFQVWLGTEERLRRIENRLGMDHCGSVVDTKTWKGCEVK